MGDLENIISTKKKRISIDLLNVNKYNNIVIKIFWESTFIARRLPTNQTARAHVK